MQSFALCTFGNTQDLVFFPRKQYHKEHFQIAVEKTNTNVITTNTYNRRNKHDEAIRIFSKHVRNHAYQVDIFWFCLLSGWKTRARFLIQSRNVAIIIKYCNFFRQSIENYSIQTLVFN